MLGTKLYLYCSYNYLFYFNFFVILFCFQYPYCLLLLQSQSQVTSVTANPTICVKFALINMTLKSITLTSKVQKTQTSPLPFHISNNVKPNTCDTVTVTMTLTLFEVRLTPCDTKCIK